MKLVVTFLLLSIILIGCKDGQKIANANGKNIYQHEFDAFVKFKRISIKDEEQKENALDQYLQREALAKLIESEILESDFLIQAELNELRKDVLINRYFDTYLAEKVSDAAVQNYYNANSEKYQERQVKVAHILVRTSRNMDESQKQVKKTTIHEAYSHLQSGMTFEDAAARYSEDAVSGKKGGSLGWLDEGSISKEFSDVAFSLEEGETSKPIETQYGFHIIKVLEAPKISQKSFSSVKGEIRYELRKAAKNARRSELLDSISIKKS